MNRYPRKYGGQLSWHRVSLKRHRQDFSPPLTLTLAQEKFRNYQKRKGFYGQLSASTLHQSSLSLERRLDVLLFRAHWVTSLYEARQWIRQGWVLVHGRPCLWKNRLCTPGETVSLRNPTLYRTRLQRISSQIQRMKETSHRLSFLEKIPEYLEVDWRIPTVTLLTYPQRSTLLYPAHFSSDEI